jgi:hypothetical protein
VEKAEQASGGSGWAGDWRGVQIAFVVEVDAERMAMGLGGADAAGLYFGKLLTRFLSAYNNDLSIDWISTRCR